MSRNYYEHTDAYRNYDARDEDRSVLSNPVPLALIGLGVGWLVWSNTSHPAVDARLRDASRRARQYGDRAMNRAEEFRDQALNRASELRDQVSNRASELGDEASSRASEWRDRASSATQSVRDRVQSQTGGQRQDFGSYQGSQSSYGDRARDYGDQASRRARQGYSSVVSLVDEHPLLAGIMGVAVGAVLGASIPSSRYENELLGDYSDDFYNRAREYGSEAIDRAAIVARTAAEAGVEAAKDAGQSEAENQGLTPEQVKNRAEEKTGNR
ncbi:ElaB/YqjD/DUF883 family membrane-anchored ribosome-binding protein [Skermanella aerolata]|uniref:hypothetical protein n=1 Tax=Skermanella aerolata TaxID=393310 RepID=UPI003D1A34EF